MGFNRISLDKVHSSFIDALEKYGIWYNDLSASGDGLTDLVAGRTADKIVFVEAKSNPRTSAINLSQLKFMAATKAYVGIATTPEELIKTVLEPEKYCLTQKEKDKIQTWIDFKSAAFFASKKDKKKRTTLLQFFRDVLGRKDVAKASRKNTSH